MILEQTQEITPQSEPRPLAHRILPHKDLRRFVKFCIVGLSSTVVNFGLFNGLYHFGRWNLVPALTFAFLTSVCNGFYWNRMWTFKEARNKPAHTQSLQFLVVNLIAWALNTTIVVLSVAHFSSNGDGIFGDSAEFKRAVMAVLTGTGRQIYSLALINGALAAATCVVVFWNFFANKFWTFKH